MTGLTNYLKKERIQYSIRLKAGKLRSIQLVEHIDGLNRHFSNRIAVIYSWRADIIRKYLNGLILEDNGNMEAYLISHQKMFSEYENQPDIITSLNWNEEYKLDTEISMNLILAMKIVSSIEERPRIERALEIVHSLSDEEISFWAWKVLSLHNRALSGFKAMYL